jgi:hypothetical protein
MKSKINELKIKNLIHSIGLKFNLTDKEINEIINSQYEFIKEKIINLDLTKEENNEELKTNFLLKYLGKLHIDVKQVKNKLKEKNERSNRNR